MLQASIEVKYQITGLDAEKLLKNDPFQNPVEGTDCINYFIL
jgi:hypothetical protein